MNLEVIEHQKFSSPMLIMRVDAKSLDKTQST